MKIQAQALREPLNKINLITNYLVSPSGIVVVDVSYGKMRAANSVQMWQVTAEGLPELQFEASKASYLERILNNIEEEIDLEITDSHYIFTIRQMIVKLVRLSSYLGYENIEEIFLKPTLVNEYILTVSTVKLAEAFTKIIDGVNPTSIGMQLTSDGVTLSGTDWFDNSIDYFIEGIYNGKELVTAFPASELRALVTLVKDNNISMCFGPSTRTRPASLLVKDEVSGLVCVLSPMNR